MENHITFIFVVEQTYLRICPKLRVMDSNPKIFKIKMGHVVHNRMSEQSEQYALT